MDIVLPIMLIAAVAAAVYLVARSRSGPETGAGGGRGGPRNPNEREK